RRVPADAQRHAPRSAEGAYRARCPHHPALRLRGEPAVPQASRGSIRVAQNRRPAPADPAPRTRPRRLDVHLRRGGLKPGPAADIGGGGCMWAGGGGGVLQGEDRVGPFWSPRTASRTASVALARLPTSVLPERYRYTARTGTQRAVAASKWKP